MAVKKGRPVKPKEVKAGNTEQAGQEIVKAKKRITPSDIEGGSSAKKKDVSRILANCLKWYKLDKVKSIEELNTRLEFFFTECFATGEIPTVEKMCLAIGYPRETVWRWETGERECELGSAGGNIIKKAKGFLATFESEMVTEGKINPVVYIFRAKNFFGMKDVQDYILTPNNALGAETNPDAITQKYKSSVPDEIIIDDNAE
jgi:hypothetical protein